MKRGRMPKLLESLRGYNLRPAFLSDLIAGLTVGLVALPLAMAFAIAGMRRSPLDHLARSLLSLGCQGLPGKPSCRRSQG